MTKGTSFTLVLLTALFAAPAALAQPQQDKQALLEQRLDQLRARVLRKEVGLDEAKAKQVEQILEKVEPERRKLRRDMAKQRRALRQLLSSDSNDQKAYAAAIRDFRAAEKRLSALREREFTQLSKVLTPKEQAKLFVALRKAQRKLQRAVRQRRQQR